MFCRKWWAAAVAVALVVVVTGANYGCAPTAGLRVETGDGAEWGVHSVKLYYDSSDNVTRRENYGADGQLTLDSNGVAIIEWEYDSAGNVVETRLYDAQGRLIE